LVTRARTLGLPFHDTQDVIPHLDELLARNEAGTRKVRMLGVSFSTLGQTQTPLAGQLDLSILMAG